MGLGTCMAEHSCAVEPFHRLLPVLRHALALFEHQRKGVLRLNVPLGRRLSEWHDTTVTRRQSRPPKLPPVTRTSLPYPLAPLATGPYLLPPYPPAPCPTLPAAR